jgi:hypothetical protein
MLRKTLLLTVVLGLVMAFAVSPVAAQDEGSGIICDDATLFLLLMGELRGYSTNTTTLAPPMDITVFDLGENQPFFDALIPVLQDTETEPLTDEFLMSELLPVMMEVTEGSESLVPTEHKAIVDEDPACFDLRISLTNYLSAVLLADYYAASAE